MSYADLFRDAFHSKRFEPVERNHDGTKYHGHRFPIKGGISLHEVMVKQMFKPNPLFQRLQARRKPKGKA